MSEPVFDQKSIREHASQVTASMRAINHLSQPWVIDESLPYPSDVAAVVAQAGRLRDTDPHPMQPGRAARACVLLTVSVAAATGRLATALAYAEQHLSCLADAEQPTPSSRPSTLDTTPTADSIDLPGLGQ